MKLCNCEDYVSNIDYYEKYKVKNSDIVSALESYFNQFVTHQMITSLLLDVPKFYHNVDLTALKKNIGRFAKVPTPAKDEDIVQIVRDHIYVFGYYFEEEGYNVSSITIKCDLFKHKNRIRFYDYIMMKRDRPEMLQYYQGDSSSDYYPGQIIIVNNDLYMILQLKDGWIICVDENWRQTQICSTDIMTYDLVSKEGEVAYND